MGGWVVRSFVRSFVRHGWIETQRSERNGKVSRPYTYIVVVDLRVQARGWVAALAGRDEGHALGIVVGRDANDGLPLGEHDEGAAENIEVWVHGARGLLAPGQSEADVRPVAHAVGRERREDRAVDLRPRVHVLEGEGLGGGEEPVEVRLELKDPVLVHAQALPGRWCTRSE